MPDYKEMYGTLFRACERAVTSLIEAQQVCEEMYINSEEPVLTVLVPSAQRQQAMTQGEVSIHTIAIQKKTSQKIPICLKRKIHRNMVKQENREV